VTLRTVEMLGEYNPGEYIAQISPTPLLLLPARNDVLTPSAFAIGASEQARHPKKLVSLPGGHLDAHGKGFAGSSGAALDWFREHLTGWAWARPRPGAG